MSKYTTGELAKLCGVSVRTVQYYDTRNILIPSELSEGGRRLYSEDDLKRMRIICFLREAGIPINGINELLTEEHPEKVISILLDQQERTLQEELYEAQKNGTCRVDTEIIHHMHPGKKQDGQQPGQNRTAVIQSSEQQSPEQDFFCNRHKNHSADEHESIVFSDQRLYGNIVDAEKAGVNSK